ncbi:LysM peptidoglycan-binding domain-containing protein [Paenibacillus sp. S150]|uniref:LysM peptidoglycan-binding domain-containing protein n=1 Tax=Paenibacillus sp. S150 TaxID=2749826 RepID=UPI001C58EBEA|nr:LysM peptidoglycan-binding domain-containing protein [Paenibacillus sp. S150]MBW4080422.1 LysM peptidoglycan-binding domain-containing protein [Paenibacillus sp. S150]
MLRYSTYRSIYDEVPESRTPRDGSAPTDKLDINKLIMPLIATLRVLLRKGNIVKLSLILLLVISGFTVVGNVFAGSLSLINQEKRVVVERGDTLWSIAIKNKPADMRTAVYIEGIKRTSGLEGSDIKAGDVLTLPIY